MQEEHAAEGHGETARVRRSSMSASSSSDAGRGGDAVDEITTAAAVAKGTFYVHFERKPTCSWSAPRAASRRLDDAALPPPHAVPWRRWATARCRMRPDGRHHAA